jgi:hypothetical protein
VGNTERAEMYLQLESIAKELKEQKWKLTQASNLITELSLFLKGEGLDNALAILENPEKKAIIDNTIELLRAVLKLEAQKADLEKKLSIKITLE